MYRPPRSLGSIMIDGFVTTNLVPSCSKLMTLFVNYAHTHMHTHKSIFDTLGHARDGKSIYKYIFKTAE